MKKNYERYFGNNFATVLYIISGILIAAGLVMIFFRRFSVLGAVITICGAIMFFITVRLKITDKEMDAVIAEKHEKFKKEHINGVIVDKVMLDDDQFDVFSGYIYDKKDLRFKVGTDGKGRTNKYFVCAILANRSDFKIFYSEYDFLSDEVIDSFLNGKGAESVELIRPTEKPLRGDYRYTVKIVKKGEEQQISFHLPDDALVDEKLRFVEDYKA